MLRPSPLTADALEFVCAPRCVALVSCVLLSGSNARVLPATRSGLGAII